MSDAMCWPEQEAVWQWMKDFGVQLTFEQENALKNAVSKYRIEIQNSKQEQGEPVGAVNVGDGGNWYFLPLVPLSELPVGTKFYTTPQHLVPLTDEQVRQVMQSLGWTGEAPSDIKFARAIEAAHGIKEKT
jgi:hypothetical protein